MNKKVSVGTRMKTAAVCGVVSMLLGVLLCMLFGVLLSKQILPHKSINSIAIVLCILSVFVGSLICVKVLKEGCMKSALLVAAAYLICTFIFKGLFFRSGVGQMAYLFPAAVLAAAAAGLIGAKRKKRR